MDKTLKNGNKKILVLKPALTLGLYFFVLSFSISRPSTWHSNDPGGNFASSLIVGIAGFLMTFLVVAIWQLSRRTFSKPKSEKSEKVSQLELFAPIFSEHDALLTIKIGSMILITMTTVNVILQLYLGKAVAAIIDMVVVGGLVLSVYLWKSRFAAVGLFCISIIVLILTGYNRFADGEGGRNLLVGFIMLWASIRLILATFRLHWFQTPNTNATFYERNENTFESKIENEQNYSSNIDNGKWSWGLASVVVIVPIVVIVMAIVAPNYLKTSKPGTYTPSKQSESVTNDPTTQQKISEEISGTESPRNTNIFDQFDEKPANEQSPPQKVATEEPTDPTFESSDNQIAEADLSARSERMKELFEIEDFYGVIKEAEAGQYLADHANILGVSLYKTNQIERAILVFQQAEIIYPDKAVIKYNLGAAFLNYGKPAQALAKYCQALNIEPKNETYKRSVASIENSTDFQKYGYSGDRVTVEFLQTRTNDVFGLFNKFFQDNLVYEGDLGQPITLTLKNVPWDFALDVVLYMNNLSVQNSNGSIVISMNQKNGAQ